MVLPALLYRDIDIRISRPTILYGLEQMTRTPPQKKAFEKHWLLWGNVAMETINRIPHIGLGTQASQFTSMSRYTGERTP